MTTEEEKRKRREYQARYRARKGGQKSYNKAWAAANPKANAAHSRHQRAVDAGKKKPAPKGKVAHHHKGYGSDATVNVTRKSNARRKHR